MAAAPSYVAVKRKRVDTPIQSLILDNGQGSNLRLSVEYKLKVVNQPSNIPPPRLKATHGRDTVAGNTRTVPTDSGYEQETPKGQPVKPSGPRHFELTTGQRSADEAGLLPTFVERPSKRVVTVNGPRPAAQQTCTPLKRPGRGSTVLRAERRHVMVDGGEDRENTASSAALAASLHSFALEEAARDKHVDEDMAEEEESDEEIQHVRPRVIVQPRRTIRRRKETALVPGVSTLGPEGNNCNDRDEDGDEYVYDIYIRASGEAAIKPGLSSRPVPSPAKAAAASGLQMDKLTLDRSPLLMPLECDSTAPRSLLNTPLPTTIPEPDFSSMLDDGSNSNHSNNNNNTSGTNNKASDPNVGFLHLPTSETEASYFWTSDKRAELNGIHDSSSSDGDGADDDEDSNAEDYYGADYPDDEVDADDELGVDAYRFRRGASESEDDFADVPGWAGKGTWTGRDGGERMWSDDEEDRGEEGADDGGGYRGGSRGAEVKGTLWRRGVGEVKDEEDEMEMT